ncbi:putative succinyl-diaminopimelate desuccinylase DapE like protein [Verticillium longisporum]|nr:putative succinyl-diaminopimelate desuccinylase DapE like protein [Verticillium longisporum]
MGDAADSASHQRLDAWVDAHFDEEISFLQSLVRLPTDTPKGNNAPHAELTADLLRTFGLEAERHPVPEAEVRAYGMESITNLIMVVTVHGKQAHAAIPDTGVDALQGAVAILNALYALNAQYREIRSEVQGITHPYLNVGRIEGGTNTNVVPGKVTFKLDRRMIPEENPIEVEAEIRRTIEGAAASVPGVSVDLRRLLLAKSMRPLPGTKPLVEAIQTHTERVFGEAAPAIGTPLYTDVRLYAEAGIPGVIYGAGPRTVLESHAKRADERLQLEDLRRATKVIARSLLDLLV